jgi:putative pre-16S rRNA nuclease
MRVLAVDPGDRRIGVAVSDPSGKIANPLTVIRHLSRNADAQNIVRIAVDQAALLIVIGQALDDDGHAGLQARKANRLAGAVRAITEIPVILWDESYTTVEARAAQLAMGTSGAKRKGHLDDLAATVLLQSYLDTHTG